ncbi:DNA replication complex GINS protein PSF1 [Mortierella sp. NVP41]|nr:DNA replication complex GINS protein PSF1 [Mortierella sp. NVP41]
MYGEEASKLARETKRTIDHFPPYNDSLVRSITREIRHLHETCQSLIREFEAQKEHEGREYARRLDVLYGRPSGLDGTAGEARGGEEDPNHTTLSILGDDHAPSASYSSTTTAVHPGAGSRAAQSGAGSSLGATALNQSTTTLAASGVAAGTTPSFSSLPRPSQQSLHAAKEDRLKELAQVFWTKYHVHETPLQRNKRILMAYHHQRLEKIKELAWAYNTLPDTLRRLLSPDEIHFFQEYERTCRNKYCSLAEFGEIDLGLGMISPPKEVFITVRVIKDCGDIVTETGAVLSLKKNSEHFVKRGDVERLITQGYLLHVA